MSLTIAYVTARRDPNIEWFIQSLAKQGRLDEFKLVLISLHYEMLAKGHITQSPPKPNVWQGEYRLTKQDWFAVANARNTALALCETDYIAYVDDLSVLMPGWLDAVKDAMAGGYIVCGAYRKVKNLVVENGEVKSFDKYADDTRYEQQNTVTARCRGQWLYGCSCAMPVEDLLTVGGWPEYCDGLGSEDYCLGICLENAGKILMYNKAMMTLESEEDHYREPSLRKTDKGVSPNDKSHAALAIARSSTYFPNYYPGGMRTLRGQCLMGYPFPVIQEPKHDWFDGQSIEEMT